MKKDIGRGTEAFKFFGDLFAFVRDFYEPEENEEYWDLCLKRANSDLSKYSECDFFILAKGLYLVVIEWLDAKNKHKSNPKWRVTLTEKDEG